MNKQISICVLTSSYPCSAEDESSIFIKRLVEGFSNYQMGGVVITPFDSYGELEETQGIFKVFRVRYGLFTRGKLASGEGIVPRLKKYPFLFFQAPGLILSLAFKAYTLRNSYNVVQANWLPVGIAALIAKCFTGIPYIVTVRGSDLKLVKLKIFNLLFKLVLKQAAHVVSVNQAFLAEVKRLADLEDQKLHYIPNGVSFQEPEQVEINQIIDKFNLDPNEKYLIHVGRVIPLKRIESLIEILKHSALKEYKLLIIGRSLDTKYLDGLIERAQILGVENRVRFLGAVDPKLIAPLLKLSKVYLSDSSHEGRPNAVLEAMAAGTPVIASQIEGHKEIIENEVNGFLSDFEKSDEIVKTILLLEDKPDLKEKIGLKAQSSISKYTWTATAKEYRYLFNLIT
ncbi:MAG: glycosyltransferase family 4 protein [Bdellovibrionota bacterium]